MIDVLLVGGAPRSGTGLLRRVLGSHPDVALPTVELALHRRLAAGQGIDETVEEILPGLPGIDPDRLQRESYGALFRSLLAAMSEATGCTVAGDKTPRIELHLPVYRSWLPGARIGLAQMVRHPYDVVASHLHADWFRRRGDATAVHDIASRWVESVELASDSSPHLAAHAVVRYEALTSTPRQVARRLCGGLGLDDDDGALDAMVDGRDFARFVNSSFDDHGEHLTGVVHRSVARRDHLGTDERAIVTEVCGPTAAMMGYDLDG